MSSSKREKIVRKERGVKVYVLLQEDERPNIFGFGSNLTW